MKGREVTEQSIAFIVLLLNLKRKAETLSQAAHTPGQAKTCSSPAHPVFLLTLFILVYYHIFMECFTPLKHPMAHPQSNLSKPYLPSEKL